MVGCGADVVAHGSPETQEHREGSLTAPPETPADAPADERKSRCVAPGVDYQKPDRRSQRDIGGLPAATIPAPMRS
jgi:hypothetical protein